MDELFTIDTKPSKRIKKILSKDRFKKKIYLNKNPHEQRIIKDMVKKIKTDKEKPKAKKPEEKSPEVYDLWGDDVNTRQPQKTMKKIAKKKVGSWKKPHPG